MGFCVCSGAVEKLQEILSDFRVLVGSVEAESLVRLIWILDWECVWLTVGL